MTLDVRLLTADDPACLAALHAMRQRAVAADTPDSRPPTRAESDGRATLQWAATTCETWLFMDGSTPVGFADYRLAQPENQHLLAATLVVDPAARRRGFGSELVAHARARAAADGRRQIVADAYDGLGFEAFAVRHGARAASHAALRRLKVADLPAARRRAMRAEAAEHAQDYALECYARPTPPDQLEEVAAAWDAMNDAPTDDLEWDDVHFDAERLRLAEAYEAALGRRGYVAVARHARTGAIAGLSELSLPPGETLAHQGDTCVLAAHRGHRLGLLVKLAMLDLLAEQEPQVTVIDTWNATSNAPMIAVNDALGCTPGVTSTEWVLDLATTPA